MPLSLSSLDEPLRSVRMQPLFVMHLKVRPLQIVGDTPLSFRRVGVVIGGSFVGERLAGEVLDGGSDWQTLGKDGALRLDVRLSLRTVDGEIIQMFYPGLRHGPAQVIERIEKGETVDPSTYYFRIAPMFETSSAKYGWLNRILAVGLGHRMAEGPIYNVFEVL